ncbi:MAG: SRPBCC family protein [Myxococcales bacterium]|jgi:hypothetical protein
MRKILYLLLAAAFVLSAVRSFAAERDWKTVESGPVTIKSRDLPGGLKEVWAQGRIDAPVKDVQATLMDSASFASFMPYVKISKAFEAKPDGSHLAYTRIYPPFVAPRDYVLDVKLEKSVGADGSGEFRNRWEAVPGKLKTFKKVVRIDHNSGSWHVKPQPGGASIATYTFVVDPGSKIPGFVAKKADRKGVLNMWKAVEKEAKRREAMRSVQASAQS